MSVFCFAQIKGLGNLLNIVLPEIIHKKRIKIFTLPQYYIYFKSKKFIMVNNCNKSDMVFGNFNCANKPVFALKYDFYKKDKNAFGVFYYRKGRPQLKFKKSTLIKFFKTIPNNLKDYVE